MGRLLLHPSREESIVSLQQDDERLRELEMNAFSISSCGTRCRIIFLLVLAAAGFSALSAGEVPVHGSAAVPSGIAWDVQGVWRAGDGGPAIRSGDLVAPGSLLRPEATDANHSITILLPDGQRILYECFTVRDCARGFRVPALQRKPGIFAATMMERIHAALAQPPRGAPKAQHIARDEAATVAGPGGRIEIGGLAAALSNGEYFGDLRSFDSRYPERSGIPLEKSGGSIAFTAPGPGLFLLTIIDSMKRPRVEFMVGVAPAKGAIVKKFHEAQAVMERWNEAYQGWPIHDFQRAYLESLMLGIRAAPGSGPGPARASTLAGVTAEPTFTPRPAVLSGDAAVTLYCATPGAVIHYTVDESEPVESSPVYHSPIMVKGTGLAIKAFAESPGKKDSTVVTGIFRIGGQ